MDLQLLAQIRCFDGEYTQKNLLYMSKRLFRLYSSNRDYVNFRKVVVKQPIDLAPIRLPGRGAQRGPVLLK